MVDTVRTVAALQALLADNATGDISPQDIRDFLVSAMNPLTSGYQKGWKDNVMPLSAAGVPNANQPILTAFGASGIREEMAFDIDDYAFVGQFHVNHDIIPDTGKAYPHVHWSTNGTSTATVKWEMQILRALGHDQDNFGSPIVVTVEQAPSGSAWRHLIAEVADIDALTLIEPDELIMITLRRITNGGTDNTDTVYGLTCDLHYESDREATLNKAPDFYA